MVINRQDRIKIDLRAVRTYVTKSRAIPGLNARDFNVCFVDDREMRRLNGSFRGSPRATDVLSFPWGKGEAGEGGSGEPQEFRGFLGEIVISVETARRNARAEGHSLQKEIQWLILHGLLHLLGYDHETDRGEMNALELSLRKKLGIRSEGTRR